MHVFGCSENAPVEEAKISVSTRDVALPCPSSRRRLLRPRASLPRRASPAHRSLLHRTQASRLPIPVFPPRRGPWRSAVMQVLNRHSTRA